MYNFFRSHGTTRDGRSFSEATKVAVWQAARIIPGLNAAEWRLDSCGARIRWSAYGDTTENGFGWEIDHIVPVAHNGSDLLSNLQALQWQNNRHKSDSLYQNYCLVQFGAV